MDKNIKITKEHQLLVNEMLELVNNKQFSIKYGELREKIYGINMHCNTAMHIKLMNISTICYHLNLPMLPVIVVNETGRPISSFYSLYKELYGQNARSEEEIYDKELSAVKNCENWNVLKDYLLKSTKKEKSDNKHSATDIGNYILFIVFVVCPSLVSIYLANSFNIFGTFIKMPVEFYNYHEYIHRHIVETATGISAQIFLLLVMTLAYFVITNLHIFCANCQQNSKLNKILKELENDKNQSEGIIK